MRRALPVLAVLILAAGCSSPEPEPAPIPADMDPADLVTERYGDCLDALDATEPVASEDHTSVLATIEGGILTWDVGQADGGDMLTIPADTATIDALETVGC